MDLRQIQYAEAVARHANFTRAAQELHVAQPALSMSVRSLEKESWASSFSRGRAGASLSRTRAPLSSSVPAGSSETSTVSPPRWPSIRAPPAGRSESVPPTISTLKIPGVLSAFVHENPLVEISIMDEPSSRMLDRLRTADLDVAFPILSLAANLTDIEHVVIGEDHLVMVVASGDPAASLPQFRCGPSRRGHSSPAGVGPRCESGLTTHLPGPA